MFWFDNNSVYITKASFNADFHASDYYRDDW